MKIITAQLKEIPSVTTQFDETLFETNILTASVVVEELKRKMLAQLKSELHTKVSLLSMDTLLTCHCYTSSSSSFESGLTHFLRGQ